VIRIGLLGAGKFEDSHTALMMGVVKGFEIDGLKLTRGGKER